MRNIFAQFFEVPIKVVVRKAAFSSHFSELDLEKYSFVSLSLIFEGSSLTVLSMRDNALRAGEERN